MIYTNERTGQYRDVPTGFSFTTLFFGPIPMLFRGQLGYFFLQLILSIVTMGISHIFFAFAINGMCEKKLQQDGFRPEIESDGKGGPGISTLIIVSALVFAFVLPSIFTTGPDNQGEDQEIAQIETPMELPELASPALASPAPKVAQAINVDLVSPTGVPLPGHKPVR